MDERFDRIESKLDKVFEKQAEMNTTLAVLTETVKTHEKRSTTLEGIVLPMKERETQMQGVVHFLQWAGGFVVGACAIAEVLRWLIK